MKNLSFFFFFFFFFSWTKVGPLAAFLFTIPLLGLSLQAAEKYSFVYLFYALMSSSQWKRSQHSMKKNPSSLCQERNEKNGTYINQSNYSRKLRGYDCLVSIMKQI